MSLNFTRIDFVVDTFVGMQDCIPKNEVKLFIDANAKEFKKNILSIEAYLYNLSPDGISLLTHTKKELNLECLNLENPIIQKLIRLSEDLYQYIAMPNRAELYYCTYLILMELI